MKFKSFMSNSHFAVSVALMWHRIGVVQVNLCQKHLFLYQLTHNMTTDCSLNYEFSTWKFQTQNILCAKIVFLFLFWDSEQFMCTTCSELGIFMYWTRNSMNNLSSYCGLVDARISASDKYLHVKHTFWTVNRNIIAISSNQSSRQAP